MEFVRYKLNWKYFRNGVSSGGKLYFTEIPDNSLALNNNPRGLEGCQFYVDNLICAESFNICTDSSQRAELFWVFSCIRLVRKKEIIPILRFTSQECSSPCALFKTKVILILQSILS